MLNDAVSRNVSLHAPPKKRPKKDWISESTWDLMVHAAWHRATIRRHVRALARDPYVGDEPVCCDPPE
eukprot:585429-Alexandrium_andersonii.AAC.1